MLLQQIETGFFVGAVPAEIESGVLKGANQVGQAVLFLLAAAQPVAIVEISYVYDAFEVIGFRKLGDDLVNFVANFLIALEGPRSMRRADRRTCRRRI